MKRSLELLALFPKTLAKTAFLAVNHRQCASSGGANPLA